MQKANTSQIVILTYSFFVALCSGLLLAEMFRSPSEPGSSIIFGFSLTRLILALGFFAAFIFFAALGFKAFRNQKWAERFLELWFGGEPISKALALFAGFSLGLGWIGYFLPSYRAGILSPHWMRIQPVMIFLLVISIATLAVFGIRRSNFFMERFQRRDVFRLGFILFFVSLPFLGLSIFSKYNAYRLEDFWYGAGVPILASQLVAAIFAGVLFPLVGRHLNARGSDILIILLLYIITAILWARVPLQKSFLFIGPYAPNKVLYPFADAATFDMASQFGLIGQGIYIFNTPFFERTLYLSFLIYLHTFVGQNYETLMTVQAVIFAVLPVLVYLIGRSLNMRAVGFVAAMITMFRGANSIAASRMIDLASPKMILTDFPAAIAIALLVLFMCEWLKKPGQKWQYALWVGSAIGLTLMLRTNALIFLLLIPLYVAFQFMPRWKNWIIASILMIFAVVAITLPWELRNVSRGAMLYEPIIMKIKNVIQTRYPSSSGSLFPQGKELSLLAFQVTKPISPLFSTAFDAQDQACQTVACFAPKHFLHNVVTSILLLPTSPVLDDLRHTVKESNPYWRPDWNGHFTPSALFFFALNVFFIMLGISVAWKRQRLTGLAPLAIFVFYNLSNAFARTSGGRYIVPIDWIISLYFVVGIFFLLSEFAVITQVKLNNLFDLEEQEEEKPAPRRSPLATTAIILIILFGIGSLVPLAEKIHAPRYANFNFTKILQEYEPQIADTGLTMARINAFLQIPGSEMLVGRTLYPRSYKMGQGEIAFPPYTVMQFPRTGFVLIGPKGSQAIVLPGGFPKYFPHAADALVIGCREQEYTDALVVILLDGTGTVYARWPPSELTCPLKQPVCENNIVCN